jgi:hypothetical protein
VGINDLFSGKTEIPFLIVGWKRNNKYITRYYLFGLRIKAGKRKQTTTTKEERRNNNKQKVERNNSKQQQQVK